jgi:hypothetical protein
MRLRKRFSVIAAVISAGLLSFIAAPSVGAAVAAPSAGPPALPAGYTTETVYIMNETATWCLDGTLAKVTMLPCSSTDLHQQWIRYIYPGYDVYLNDYNYDCLDGTEADVSVQPCNITDAHQRWIRITYTSGNMLAIYYIENVANEWALDNRPTVVLKPWLSDLDYQLWTYSEVGT